MGTDFVRLELQVYFYWRPCEASTDRKLRKRETGDISIRASPGNALIASISTSTSTSGRDRFFPSVGPKKHASHCHVKPWSNKNDQNSVCYETRSFKGRYLALLRRLWRLYQRWHRLLHLITIQVPVVKISLVHLYLCSGWQKNTFQGLVKPINYHLKPIEYRTYHSKICPDIDHLL